MKPRAVCLALLALCCACATAELPGVEREGTQLDVAGELAPDAPTVSVDGVEIRFAEHRVAARAGQPLRIALTSASEEFDPLLECRPLDGQPNETLRCDDTEELGTGAQLEVIPERDGPWIIYVGDRFGRPGPYRLRVEPISEREVFAGRGETLRALTGTEPPVTFFCPVSAGRRYRVALDPRGFPAHLALAAPGVAELRSNSHALEFVAARTGQAVLQVSSLSLASGPFVLTVTELW